MPSPFHLVAPPAVPPLDPAFRPAVLANRAFRREVVDSGVAEPLALVLERSDGAISRYDTVVFAETHPRAGANLDYVERLVKFLLWQRGGWRLTVGGPASIGPLLSGGYRKIRASFALSVFVFSVKGGMGAEGTQGFDVYWDRAYLGTSSPVFLDDFEAESTCRWSATASP